MKKAIHIRAHQQDLDKMWVVSH